MGLVRRYPLYFISLLITSMQVVAFATKTCPIDLQHLRILPKQLEKALEANKAFATQTVHRLVFKASSLLFVVFMTMDILFGDRTELWEHGTFLLLTAFAYRLYIDHEQIEAVEEAQISSSN